MKIRLGMLAGIGAGYLIGSGKAKELLSKASAAAGRAPTNGSTSAHSWSSGSPVSVGATRPSSTAPMSPGGTDGIVVPAGVVESTPSSLGEP